MSLIKDKKVFGWAMYDWANSAFATTVMAGFFPVFFKSYWSVGTNVNESTALLGMINSISSLIIALIAPVIGAVADQSSGKKRFLIFFAYFGAVLTGCLFLVDQGNWVMAAIIYGLANIGFAGANNFYDALLTDVADEKKIDFVSSKGYAYGYLGGGLLFLLNVVWYLSPATFGLPVEKKVVCDYELQRGATVIRLNESIDFSIPDSLTVRRAIVTSEFTRPIRIVSQKLGDDANLTEIEVALPAGINLSLLDNTIVFGEYQHGTLKQYDAKMSTLLVGNLTRDISDVDLAHFTLNNTITYRDYRNGVLTGVSGLDNHYGKVTIKSDFLKPPVEFLSIRLSFLSVALWWGIFTIPLIIWVKEKKTNAQKRKRTEYILMGFRQLKETIKKIRHLKVVFLFLAAYWLYIDGVDTIIKMAVDYGMSIGFPSNSLIVALLITQFVGFPAAIVFGKLGEKWNVKKAIFIAISVYLFVTVYGVMMDEIFDFYILAIIVGLVQGGIQALSRSYYSRLIPKEQSAEFYGFYNMLGKFATILGPVLVGFSGLIASRLGYSSNLASRIGISSVGLLFIAGAILLYFVDEQKGQKEVEYLRLQKGSI